MKQEKTNVLKIEKSTKLLRSLKNQGFKIIMSFIRNANSMNTKDSYLIKRKENKMIKDKKK